MRRKKIIIFVLVLCLIILLMMLFSRREPKYNLSPVLAKNIEQPYFLGSEVYFYTGHGFAKYSTANQNTATLSNFMTFPKVISMSISDKNAVFKTDSTSPADSFYTYLKNRGMATDSPYWWLTDFNSGETSLIGEKEGFASKITYAKQAGNDLLVVKPVDEHTSTKKYDLLRFQDKIFSKLKTLSNETFVEIVWANQEKIIYSSKKEGQKRVVLNVLDLASQKSETLPESIGGGNVTVSNNGDFIAYQTSSIGEISEKKPDKLGLYFYKIGDKNPKLVLEGFAGIINRGVDEGFLVSGHAGKNKPITAMLEPSGKLSAFGIKGDPPSISSLGGLARDSGLIGAIDDSQNFYVLSKHDAKYKESPALPSSAIDLSQPSYNIHYFDSSKNFSILILQNPYQDNLNLALKDLQSKGVDTNQYEIFARPARSLDASF